MCYCQMLQDDLPANVQVHNIVNGEYIIRSTKLFVEAFGGPFNVISGSNQ